MKLYWKVGGFVVIGIVLFVLSIVAGARVYAQTISPSDMTDPQDPLFNARESLSTFKIPQARDNTPKIQALKSQMTEKRKNGGTNWGSKDWMKPLTTYQKMDTYSLVDECFSRPIFGTEMMVFDDPLVGLMRLQVYHDGFQELFKRNDMWRGIIHYMDSVSRTLVPGVDLQHLVMHMLNINGIVYLYEMDSFANQMVGHEQEYLDAHLRLINAFVGFIDAHSASRDGDTYGFFREPIVIASQAVALYRRVHPNSASDLELRLAGTISRRKQDMREVRSFLKQVLDATGKK